MGKKSIYGAHFQLLTYCCIYCDPVVSCMYCIIDCNMQIISGSGTPKSVTALMIFS